MKIYMSRRATKFWSAEMPIGDPFGGAPYGEKNDPVTAAIGVGGAIVGGVLSSKAAGKAASQAANASEQAVNSQQGMFNTINAQQKPWRVAGKNALGSISDMQPYFNHQFDANDLNANLAPNYEFQLGQGLGAVKNFANSTGGLVSGNTLKGINDYAQNFAGNAYQNAFNNYSANQTNIFNRLSTIAGLGNSANASTAGAGANISQGVGNSLSNIGAAQAAGTIGQANALSSGISNGLGWYQLGNFLQPSSGGSSGAGGLYSTSQNFSPGMVADYQKFGGG
jgi:hypothetical protein